MAHTKNLYIIKRANISVAILLFLSVSVYSQPVKAKLGLKAGLSVANPKIESQASGPGVSNRKTMPTGGGFVNLYLGKNFMIQPAIMFVSKGGGNYNAPRAGYMEIPLNGLYISTGNKGRYFLGGGLSPAFKLNHDYYGFYEDPKKFDLGISVLMGYMFPIGFSFNLGYTHGILNVSGDDTYTMHNRYFGITAGYEF